MKESRVPQIKTILLVLFLFMTLNFTLADDRSYLQGLIDGSSGTVSIPAGTYTIGDELIIDQSKTILASGTVIIKQTNYQKAVFQVDCSNVTIDGFKLEGTGSSHVISSADHNAIDVLGLENDYLENITIQNCEIYNWGYAGIRLKFVEKLYIKENTIYDITYAGIMLLSCSNTGVSSSTNQVWKNNISHIECLTENDHGYGIAVNVADSSDPRSTDIVVSENTVTDVATWEGLDTHGGTNITFYKNTVTNCSRGIVATIVPDTYAPLNCRIEENTITTNVNYAPYGIVIRGLDNSLATGRIYNNTVDGHGYADSSTIGAITSYLTQGIEIEDNIIKNSKRTAVCMYYGNSGFLIDGNQFHNTIHGSAPVSIRITYVQGYPNNGGISNNIFTNDPCAWSISNGNSSYNYVTTANNIDIASPTYQVSGLSETRTGFNPDGLPYYSFSWNAAPNAASYKVYFGTTTLIERANPTTPNWSYGYPLTWNKTYQYRIDSINPDGDCIKEGDVKTFSTGTDPNLAAAVTTIDEEIYAYYADGRPYYRFSWDAAANAEDYKVYFGTTNLLYRTTTAGLTWSYGPASFNKTYKIRVDTINQYGQITTGSVMTFTTPSSAAPAAVTDVSAVVYQRHADGRPYYRYSWSAAANATDYKVYFGTTTLIERTTTEDLTWSYGPMTIGKNYQIRIDSVNQYGTTTGSVYWVTAQ